MTVQASVVEVTKPRKATLREGTGCAESAAGLDVSRLWFIGKSLRSGYGARSETIF
jgi:hypothetical protein